MLVLLLATSMSATAASVYGTGVDTGYLSGSRSLSGDGLKKVSHNLSRRATVSWDISWNGTFWDYSYYFSSFHHHMSDVTFDVSDCFLKDPSECFIVDDKVYTYLGRERNIVFGDFNNIFGAFKTRPGGITSRSSITFQSTNAPMWGDMYMKGVLFEAANYWWDDHNNGDDMYGYIPVPDTIGNLPPGEIPVPAAGWLFGSGLVGLIGISRRKRAYSYGSECRVLPQTVSRRRAMEGRFREVSRTLEGKHPVKHQPM